MSGAALSSGQAEGELKLGELIEFLRRSRWLILSVTAACTIAVAVAAWLIPRKYEGVVLLLPVSSQSSSSELGALASVASQFSGLASSLTGLNLSAGGGNKAEAVATLQSRTIAQRFIQDHNLLPILFSEKWDRVQQKWYADDPHKIPSLWKGMNYFEKSVLNVTENAKTGLVTLTITWTDAKLAASWANDLVKATNEYMRNKAIKESQRNIDYLNEQAAKTTSVELRNAIYTVLESEIKKEMVAQGSEEYALKVVDPAIPPEVQSFPRPVLWTVGGLFVGLMFGIIASVVRNALAQT
jgi:uncharacterized protein involved in exopolysaccharide biosynthesis